MKYSIRTLCAVVCLGFTALAQAEVAVIVNPGAAAAPSQSDVGNIFLGKDKSMKGVDHKDWSATKEKFYGAVTNKSESQLKSYCCRRHDSCRTIQAHATGNDRYLSGLLLEMALRL